MIDAGIVQRQTASVYLKKREETGILASRKVERANISAQTALLKLLMEPYNVSMKLMYFDTFG